jgi:flagellar biosynthesis protein FlhF
MDELRGEVGLLTRRLEQSPSGAAVLETDPLVSGLVEAGVELAAAAGVVTRARERLGQKAFGSAPPPKDIDLRAELARSIPTTAALWMRRDRVVAAFIGPTGVGKTTTLAKIAAAAALIHRKRVALIAADTYRIAGIEQVRTYANLIGLPVRQARDRKELGQALVAFRDLDLVLIDTTGRNPWSDEALGQVSGMFDETRIEKHLCVSATTRPQDLQDIVKRYQAAGLASLIVTKLDEARGPGAVLTATWASRQPVSHLCTGQQVPEDIEAADSDRLAKRIMDRFEAARRERENP